MGDEGGRDAGSNGVWLRNAPRGAQSTELCLVETPATDTRGGLIGRGATVPTVGDTGVGCE